MLTDSKDGVITILVIDDHPVVAGGVRMLLAADRTLQIAGDAPTATEGILKASQLQPDVVLLDLRLPGSTIESTIEALRVAVPGVKIVVFTAHSNPAAVAQALEAGVDGYLLKDASDHVIAESLRQVATGGSVFRLTGRSETGDFIPTLTRREIEVLRRTATGRTNPETARDLGLSSNTVKSYLQTAMQKLGARNRVEAITRANEAGLL
jgi:DNA-binding NarL/FixJ family response regulator